MHRYPAAFQSFEQHVIGREIRLDFLERFETFFTQRPVVASLGSLGNVVYLGSRRGFLGFIKHMVYYVSPLGFLDVYP